MTHLLTRRYSSICRSPNCRRLVSDAGWSANLRNRSMQVRSRGSIFQLLSSAVVTSRIGQWSPTAASLCTGNGRKPRSAPAPDAGSLPRCPHAVHRASPQPIVALHGTSLPSAPSGRKRALETELIVVIYGFQMPPQARAFAAMDKQPLDVQSRFWSDTRAPRDPLLVNLKLPASTSFSSSQARGTGGYEWDGDDAGAVS